MINRIKVGNFILEDIDDDQLYIGTLEGESGVFDKADFEKVVDDFYRENF